MVRWQSGVYARRQYAVTGVGDEDKQADHGNEGAHLRESSSLGRIVSQKGTYVLGSDVLTIRLAMVLAWISLAHKAAEACDGFESMPDFQIA